MDSAAHHYFALRWAKTSEARLIAQTNNKLDCNSSGFSGNGKRSWMAWLPWCQSRWYQFMVCISHPTGIKTPPIEIWRGLSDQVVHTLCKFMVLCSHTQEQRWWFWDVTCVQFEYRANRCGDTAILPVSGTRMPGRSRSTAYLSNGRGTFRALDLQCTWCTLTGMLYGPQCCERH